MDESAWCNSQPRIIRPPALQPPFLHRQPHSPRLSICLDGVTLRSVGSDGPFPALRTGPIRYFWVESGAGWQLGLRWAPGGEAGRQRMPDVTRSGREERSRGAVPRSGREERSSLTIPSRWGDGRDGRLGDGWERWHGNGREMTRRWYEGAD